MRTDRWSSLHSVEGCRVFIPTWIPYPPDILPPRHSTPGYPTPDTLIPRYLTSNTWSPRYRTHPPQYPTSKKGNGAKDTLPPREDPVPLIRYLHHKYNDIMTRWKHYLPPTSLAIGNNESSQTKQRVNKTIEFEKLKVHCLLPNRCLGNIRFNMPEAESENVWTGLEGTGAVSMLVGGLRLE